MPATTLYDLLEITRNASAEDIRFAYRRKLEALSREGPAGEREAADLRAAYDTLSNPLSRMSYDASLGQAAALTGAGESGLASGTEGSLIPRGIKRAGVLLIIGLLVLFGLRQYAASRASGTPKAAASAAPAKVVEGVAPAEPGATPIGVLPRSPDELYAAVNTSVAKVVVKDFYGNEVATGSGVVVGPGIVVTNCHVVKKSTMIDLKFPNETFSAVIQSRNDDRDLCNLYAGNLTARPVPIASANTLKVGQKVYAVGSPYGLENTLSEGIVSGLRDVDGGRIVQTSAAISPGSSGGGLFDINGNLVGITTFQHKSGQNLNFALPSDWITGIPGGQYRSVSPSSGAKAAEEVPAKPPEPKPAEIMLGTWTCSGKIEGLSGKWTVSPTHIEIAETGKGGTARKLSYALHATKLVIYTRPSPTQVDVELISDKSLVFLTFTGDKTTCDPVQPAS